ncbi:MAG TPA: hypothetical protein PK052_00085 [Anaerohalosphaeraceae bacterium]|nr:hypothetical protein [Anaerohalosphaeraceae bacterium]HOL30352.1 hypothetical protein [Anaerohalosphaeraceae bacterium]HOM76720.1 hypothetical protein [Anaerohalosphaeraceae bacterium]HPC63050.1 hypothetical protein [Anaerohalosphaeraceae bacterium]HPO69249.1 hypothetical protein [Anaerohalosphaeraceae bacterium]
MTENDYRIVQPLQNFPAVAGLHRIDGNTAREKRQKTPSESKPKKDAAESTPDGQLSPSGSKDCSGTDSNGHFIDIRA